MPCSLSKSRTIWLAYRVRPVDLRSKHFPDVAVARLERDAGRQGHRAGQVRGAREVVPPGVGEVLVEGGPAHEVGTGHHPLAALVEHGHANLAAELVVDVTPDGEGEVDDLGLEAQDLAAQQLVRRRVVLAHGAEQLLVALVAAKDGIGQVELDERGLHEVGIALVFERFCVERMAQVTQTLYDEGAAAVAGRSTIGVVAPA